jgi:hypothetical protein
MRAWRFIAPLLLLTGRALAQTPAEQEEDAAVGESINYVFATDLGSGIYDLDGRTLQIYRLTWRKQLREARADQVGVQFVLPGTVGFFDFSPLDVLEEGPPTRVDSLSIVPGIELDYLLRNDWHLIPYVRTGFSFASSSVDGWLYGAGFRLEQRIESTSTDWDSLIRTELNYSGVEYTHETPSDQFLRVRQAFDFTHGIGWHLRNKELELGVYAIFDAILDPPTAPLADAEQQPLQAEFGITLSTRPRYKLWRFDMPRLGFGYRIAGDLSAWRFVIGVPF